MHYSIESTAHHAQKIESSAHPFHFYYLKVGINEFFEYPKDLEHSCIYIGLLKLSAWPPSGQYPSL